MRIALRSVELPSRAVPCEVAEYTPTILKPTTISNPGDKKTKRQKRYTPPTNLETGNNFQILLILQLWVELKLELELDMIVIGFRLQA